MCDTPYYVQRAKWAPEKVPVPCGRCPPCKLRRVNEWVFRIQQEELSYEHAHFVTLTYDTRFVPITPHGFMSLRKEDTQLFWKRLRKRVLHGVRIKYYLAGEYGSKNKRPHYHAIVMGVPDPEFFHLAWQLGTVHVGKVTGDSIAYTLKYIDKPSRVPEHKRDDRLPEFSLKSLGMGLSYITDQSIAYHQADLSRLYLVKPGGYRIALPKYYRQRLYTEEQRSMQVDIVQSAIAEREEQNRAEHLRSGANVTYEEKIENQKIARYRKFYARQKNRDI